MGRLVTFACSARPSPPTSLTTSSRQRQQDVLIVNGRIEAVGTHIEANIEATIKANIQGPHQDNHKTIVKATIKANITATNKANQRS